MAEKEETTSDTKLDSLTTLYDWNPINGSYAFFGPGFKFTNGKLYEAKKNRSTEICSSN